MARVPELSFGPVIRRDRNNSDGLFSVQEMVVLCEGSQSALLSTITVSIKNHRFHESKQI